jgi:hypothetical protein
LTEFTISFLRKLKGKEGSVKRNQSPFSNFAILSCFILNIFFLAYALAAEAPRMSKEELQAMLGNPEVIIIDVRSGSDWTSSDSKIKGALREDPGKVETWIDKYPKDKTLAFY